MPATDLSPEERFHQIAGLLARGILRLHSRPTPPETAPESPKKALELTPKISPHVPVG